MKQLILILSLAGLACVLQVAPATVVDVEVAPTPTPEIVIRSDLLTPVPTREIQTYTVTAYRLWIRDGDGDSDGYLENGDLVICKLSESGWCMLDRGRRVWGGCLDPNPMELGCEEK